MSAAAVRTIGYGDHPDQFVEFTLPEGQGPVPLVVVVHGGFWRSRHTIELARPVAADLAAAGYAVAAVEYRRGSAWPYPYPLLDVAAGVDLLAQQPEAARFDPAQVTVIGHSAGGQMAAWLASRHRLPEGAVGAGPRLHPTAAVLQGGVLDLDLAVEQGTGKDAVQRFLGPRTEVPERYPVADPIGLLPTGVAVLCVHSPADVDVPIEQSERYVRAARAAGDAAELLRVGGDHMSLVDPASAGWEAVRRWLAEWRSRTTLEP